MAHWQQTLILRLLSLAGIGSLCVTAACAALAV